MNASTPRPAIGSSPRSRKSRWRRVVTYLLFGLFALVLLTWAGLHLYLQSAHARQLAAERLSDMLGMPVDVQDLDVGSSETTVKLRIAEILPPMTDQPARDAFRVASVTADISMLDLITGRVAPKELKLKGVEIHLTIDRDGKPLTSLPKRIGRTGSFVWPRIRIEDAALTLRQEGRPPFELRNLQLIAERRENLYQLQGTTDDPRWGRWTVAGSLDPDKETGHVAVAIPDGPLDMELLRSIPYVPEDAWKHVQASGRTAAAIRFDLPESEALRYEVTLTPAGRAELKLPDLDVPLSGVAGTIRIRGQEVVIEKCRAALADGQVQVDGLLDFKPVRSKLTFKVSAQGLDVAKLPAEWSLPPQLTGKLRGEADLQLQIDPDGKLEPRGDGEAFIDEARIAGLPAEVKLRLRGDGRRYRFESEIAALADQISAFLREPPKE